MKRSRLGIFVILLVFGALTLVGCGGSGEEKTSKKQPGQGYSTPTPDAGQPIDHPEVLSQSQERLKENPRDWQALRDTAKSHFGLNQYNDAIDYYKRAVEVNPDDVDSFNDLALSHHYLGRSSEGLEFVEKGIESNPYYQRIWLTKGFILAYGTGDLDKARQAWQQTKKLDPESPIGKAASDFLAQFVEGR